MVDRVTTRGMWINAETSDEHDDSDQHWAGRAAYCIALLDSLWKTRQDSYDLTLAAPCAAASASVGYVRVHKAIVIEKSPVLRGLVDGTFCEGVGDSDRDHPVVVCSPDADGVDRTASNGCGGLRLRYPVTTKTLQLVLEYCYTGRVWTEAIDLMPLACAADYLGVEALCEACTVQALVTAASEQHCSPLPHGEEMDGLASIMGIVHERWGLRGKVLDQAASALPRMARRSSNTLAEIPVEALGAMLGRDELSVRCEEEVLDLVARWLAAQPLCLAERVADGLLSKVRGELIDPAAISRDTTAQLRVVIGGKRYREWLAAFSNRSLSLQPASSMAASGPIFHNHDAAVAAASHTMRGSSSGASVGCNGGTADIVASATDRPRHWEPIDVCTMQVSRRIVTGHDGPISALVSLYGGSIVVSTGFDGLVIVWHTATWKLLHILDDFRGLQILCAAAFRETLFTGHASGELHAWDFDGLLGREIVPTHSLCLNARDIVEHGRGRGGPIVGISLAEGVHVDSTKRRNLLWVASAANGLRCYDAETLELVTTVSADYADSTLNLQAPSALGGSDACVGDINCLLCYGSVRELRVLDTNRLFALDQSVEDPRAQSVVMEIGRATTGRDAVATVAIGGNGLLAYAGMRGVVTCIRMEAHRSGHSTRHDVQPVAVLTGHVAPVQALLWSSTAASIPRDQKPDSWLLSIGIDTTMRVWNVEAKECVRVIEFGHRGIHCATLHLGHCILTSTEATINVWRS